MDFFLAIIDFVLHIDVHLLELIQNYGTWVYAIVFAIVFAETGLVVTPILPGDSLIFALGAFAAKGSLHLGVLYGLLLVAAIAGDALNYSIGKGAGEMLIKKYPRIFRPQYLEKTREFFAKYGGKTIIIARFIPIVRTFAPFLAGVGHMRYRDFVVFNVVGAALWVSLFIFLGYFFGNIPVIAENFSLVILGIIGISLIPPVLELIKRKKV